MGIEKIPLHVPDQWSADWFRNVFIREILSKLDTRNAIGDGIVVSSAGNSVATLSSTDAIDTAIATHDGLATAHAVAFAAHRAETDPHPDLIDDLATATSVALTDLTFISQSGTNRQATVSQVMQGHRDEADPHPDLIDDLTTATSVAESDLVIVSQSGTNRRATVDQVGDAVFGDDWDDLVITGTAVNPPGAASDPTLNNTTGLLEFSASADNVVTFVWQIPHGWSGAWDSSTAMATVVPHLHVRHLTSTSAPNNVSRWKFEYDRASVDGDFANAYGTFTNLGTVSSTNPANTARHSIISFGNLNLTGHGISTMVHAKVSRLANSDGADLDTSVIVLYSADLHIRRRRWGTESEYSTP